MIRIAIPEAPAHYEAEVLIPGQAFLANTPNPSKKQWDEHKYWAKIHYSLYDSLQGICSYCASFTPKPQRYASNSVDHTSIDHFIPKAKDAKLAYEWNNFRLCRSRLNHRKDNYEDVLDPYEIQDGWFCLNFETFLLFSDETLSEDQKKLVQKTIDRFKLNDDDDYINERARVVFSFASGEISQEELVRFYPFIAKEIVAQNFEELYLPSFRAVLNNSKFRQTLSDKGWIP